MSTITYSRTLNATDCAECGITFGIPVDFERVRRQDGRTFWCPNGHSLSYGKSESDRLREQLKRTERHLANTQVARDAAQDQAKAAEYRRRAAVGANTKLRKRIAAGVCPCCQRSFGNLAAHMTDKHPGYSSEVTDA